MARALMRANLADAATGAIGTEGQRAALGTGEERLRAAHPTHRGSRQDDGAQVRNIRDAEEVGVTHCGRLWAQESATGRTWRLATVGGALIDGIGRLRSNRIEWGCNGDSNTIGRYSKACVWSSLTFCMFSQVATLAELAIWAAVAAAIISALASTADAHTTRRHDLQAPRQLKSSGSSSASNGCQRRSAGSSGERRQHGTR
jgi:hypothetical protein